MSLMLVFNHLPIHPTWRMTINKPTNRVSLSVVLVKTGRLSHQEMGKLYHVIIILSTIAKWDVNL